MKFINHLYVQNQLIPGFRQLTHLIYVTRIHTIIVVSNVNVIRIIVMCWLRAFNIC